MSYEFYPEQYMYVSAIGSQTMTSNTSSFATITLAASPTESSGAIITYDGTNKITFGEKGLYLVTYELSFTTTGTTTNTYRSAQILFNGTTQYAGYHRNTTTSTPVLGVSSAAIIQATAITDFVQLQAYQSSTSTLTVGTNTYLQVYQLRRQ